MEEGEVRGIRRHRRGEKAKDWNFIFLLLFTERKPHRLCDIDQENLVTFYCRNNTETCENVEMRKKKRKISFNS